MSKKNLSRTILEGGREGHSKYYRRLTTQIERAEMTSTLNRLDDDIESHEDTSYPVRAPAYVGFTDKLSPVYRWVDKQVGRVWNEVRSELFEKFDPRSLAGRHIIYDHILPSIKQHLSEDNSRYPRYYSYYVDEEGILHKTERKKRRHYEKREPISNKMWNRTVKWVDDRKVGFVGQKAFWFVQNTPRAAYPECWPYWRIYDPPTYRQDKEFTRDDIEFWNKLPGWVRSKFVIGD